MTFYELLKRVYWALDEWIASSLGLGEYYGADDADDADDASDNNEDISDNNEDVSDKNEEDEEMADEDDGYDDMYKYHDHQA
jgi:hypothetical protein